jgi:hypothetical protein
VAIQGPQGTPNRRSKKRHDFGHVFPGAPAPWDTMDFFSHTTRDGKAVGEPHPAGMINLTPGGCKKIMP